MSNTSNKNKKTTASTKVSFHENLRTNSPSPSSESSESCTFSLDESSSTPPSSTETPSTMKTANLTTAMRTTTADDVKKMYKSALVNYLRFLQSPSRQEAILKTVQYTLWLLSRFYRNKLQQSMLTTVSGEISWTRYLLRFFGWPAALEGIESGSWADSKGLGKAMAWTMVAYYPLEHLAYLYWKVPDAMPTTIPASIGTSFWSWRRSNTNNHNKYDSEYTISSTATTATCSRQMVAAPPSRLAAKASAWSCRFWLAYLVLDIARSMLAMQNVRRKMKQNNDGGGGGDADGKKTKTKPPPNGQPQEPEQLQSDATVDVLDLGTMRTERMQLVRDLLYVLPAIHWSLPNWDTQPWLSDTVVNGLCWLESIVGLMQGIHNFRQT